MAGKNGGARPGAGRKPGKVTAVKRELAEIAKPYAQSAFQTLVDLAESGEAESTRLQAAVAILDRAYGRPAQAVHMSGENGGPLELVSRIERFVTNATERPYITDRDSESIPTAH